MRYLLSLGLLLFCWLNPPSCSAEFGFDKSKLESENVISKTEIAPPVERVRPPDEKKKKEKKKPRKNKKDPNKTQDGGSVFLILLISFLVLFLVGAFMFGFGISILAIVIVGLILMGIGNLAALFVVFLMTTEKGSVGDSAVATFFAVAGFIFVLLQGILDFAVGLAFLIWGLLAAGSVAWILGIVLLALFLILLIFILAAVKKVQ